VGEKILNLEIVTAKITHPQQSATSTKENNTPIVFALMVLFNVMNAMPGTSLR
jgi:hypothetical protein